MRPIMNFTLHVTLAAALIAFAASSAAAAGYLKLGDIKGDVSASSEDRKDFYKGWIELNSWQWGETRTGKAQPKEFTVTRKTDTATAGDPDRPLVAARVPNAGVEREMKESSEKGGTEDMNIGVGELQECAPAGGGVQVAAADVSGERAAACAPAGKRQHKPITISKEMDKSSPKLMEAATKGKVFASPAPRGSMTFKGQLSGCAVGNRYPNATLQTASMRYEMENVLVSSCSSSGSGGGSGSSPPMEEISFNYEKITTVSATQDKQAPKTKVRGWDPEKKE